jgi:hypothetical protein
MIIDLKMQQFNCCIFFKNKLSFNKKKSEKYKSNV